MAPDNTQDSLNTEDYNQIDPANLDCFPPDKYPVDLFQFHENGGMLTPIYRAGEEVSSSMRERFRKLSADGVLFFTRRQIDEYTEAMACDLNLALDDPNLTWDEKSVVFIGELKLRQDAFFGHPMPQELESLTHTLESLCVYLIEDNRRMATLVRDLHADLSPERRRVNASLMALAVYMEIHKGNILTEILETVALGFFLYDIGMTKVSHLMIGKSRKLTPREQRTVQEHPLKSVEILRRLNLTRAEIIEPAVQHHERINGSGYPGKLRGKGIGLLGRIVGVTDTYCAMTTDTPQRKGVPPIEAAAELVSNEGAYDQVVCRTLIRYLQTIPS